MKVLKKLSGYVHDKNFAFESDHLTEADYMKIQWMNVVPEIICDILAYIASYIHHRTDSLGKEAYTSMLTGQVQ